jgi:multiple sugar transport system permease protein
MARRVVRSDRIAPYVFAAPFALFLLVFGAGPAVYAVWTSFRKDTRSGESVWAGLENWQRAFTDPRLPDAVTNVGTYLLMWLPTMLLLVASLALLAHAQRGRLSTTSRLAWYLPGAVAGSAAALLTLYMLTPGMSPFTPILDALGIESGGDLLRGSGTAAVLAILATAINAGGWIVVLYAALNAIPHEILEAAKVDGAGAWRTALSIKLPMVRGQLALMLIGSFAYGTQVFVEPQVLRAGFPSQVSPTWSINQLSYFFAADRGNFGMAAALSLTLLAVGMVVALIVIRKTRMYATDAEA